MAGGGRVCVVGSLAYDLSVRIPALPRAGETVLGTDLQVSPGGKGFNQAIAAARAGAHTSMVGAVGEDGYGTALCALLTEEGIDASGVVTVPGSTGLAFPFVDATGQNTVVAALGANAALTAADVHLDKTDVVLTQLETSPHVVMAAAEQARAMRAVHILNPAPAQALSEELLALVDVLVPNETEAELLLGTAVGDPVKTALALRERFGVPSVVLTLAERGAVISDLSGEREIAAISVECVDSVGAGDAFCGYLAAALAEDAPLDHAVRRANAAGALAVTQRGAAVAMPHASEVGRLLIVH